jgi:hypothetical protein
MCVFISDYEYSKLFKRKIDKIVEEEEEQQPEIEKEEEQTLSGLSKRTLDIQVADYDNNHSLTLLLSKFNFFSYDSLDGGSSRVTGPFSL